jgi:uncharacterized phage protein gp47/JayE
MPWPLLSLRQRREQVRDDIAAHVPDADASVPNTVLRAVGDAQAALTHDNDLHLDWVARMMMPDTAEGEFAERWANIWLPNGRKGATFAAGFITVTGLNGSAVPTGAELTLSALDADGNSIVLQFEVVTGVTLSGSSAAVVVSALTPGALANLDEGAMLAFVDPPTGIDGRAAVAAPGFAGGADQETDADLRDRTIARIQAPPHGGAKHDYVAWALEVPGVTRAWAAREMGPGTITVRVMLDDVRADDDGLPESEDLALVLAYIDAVRPVTVADLFVLSPVRQDETVTISLVSRDSPEVRASIREEIRSMLAARAAPGQIIYASWVREAISSAVGEDYHDTAVANLIPDNAGSMIFIEVVFS